VKISFEFSGFRVEEVQSMACTHPDPSVPVLINGPDRIIGYAPGIVWIMKIVPESLVSRKEKV